MSPGPRTGATSFCRRETDSQTYHAGRSRRTAGTEIVLMFARGRTERICCEGQCTALPASLHSKRSRRSLLALPTRRVRSPLPPELHRSSICFAASGEVVLMPSTWLSGHTGALSCSQACSCGVPSLHCLHKMRTLDVQTSWSICDALSAEVSASRSTAHARAPRLHRYCSRMTQTVSER